MAGLGASLVEPAPAGPGRPVADGVRGTRDQFGEQAADLVDSQRSQLTVVWAAGAFTRGDHGEDGVREHDQRGVPVPGVPAADLVLVQPGGVLAGLEGRFERQRVPATRTRMGSTTGVGEKQR